VAANEMGSELSRTETATARYPVDLRFTIPFFPRSLFVCLIIGQERRSAERRAEERALHPLETWGNFAVSTIVGMALGIAILFLGIALGGL
jgi:hypothetical protein